MRYFLKKTITRGKGITMLKEGDQELKTITDILSGIEKFYGHLYEKKEIQEDTLQEVLNFVEKKVNTEDDVL